MSNSNKLKSKFRLYLKIISTLKEKPDKKKDIIVIIANFIAVVFGVLLAFCIENHRISQNEITACKNKLFAMSLEANRNARNGVDIWKCYGETNTASASIIFLDDSAARSVFEDINITRIITSSELALISDYINTIQQVNSLNEKYLFHIDAVNYQLLDQGKKLRKLLRFNSSSFIAICHVLQEDVLKKYTNNRLDSTVNIYPYKTKIDSILNNFIINGKVDIIEK